MSITMKEIAKIAGVDISTVSRALNNESTISNDVKRRIINIAQKNNYKRRRPAAKNISYVIDKRFFHLTSHFYNRVIEGIEEEVKNNNLIFRFNSLDPEEFSLKKINVNNLAGMIITSCYHDDFIIEVKKLGIPIVLVDYYLPTEDISSVLIDNIDGIIKGMRYLAGFGHKRIAYLKGDVNEIGSHDRFIGYRRAVQLFGLDDDENLIMDCDFSITGAYSSMKKFLESTVDYPTALFAVNDIVAIGAMEAIKEKNLKIPEDICVLGFDDIDLANEVIPRLSTMHVRKRTIGKLAVQRLLQLIGNEEIEYSKILVSPVLCERESTKRIGEEG